MPFPFLAAAQIAAPILGIGVNAASQGKMNKSSREFAKEQMWRENEINLENWNKSNQYNEGLWNKQNEYNQQMWNMENQYNSPKMQMQRFKEAGLNPHLIYGQQSTGGSVATANLESESMKPSAHAEWHPKAPEFDLAGGLMQYMSFKEKGAQTNNLEKQGAIYDEQVKLLAEQALNVAADTENKLVGTEKNRWDLNQAINLSPYQLDAADLSNQKARQGMELDKNRDSRETALNKSQIAMAMESMKSMRGDQLLKALEAQLKGWEIELNKMNLKGSDSPAYRWLSKMVQTELPKQYQWDGTLFKGGRNYKNHNVPKINHNFKK